MMLGGFHGYFNSGLSNCTAYRAETGNYDQSLVRLLVTTSVPDDSSLQLDQDGHTSARCRPVVAGILVLHSPYWAYGGVFLARRSFSSPGFLPFVRINVLTSIGGEFFTELEAHSIQS
ncbi:hypothetical protein A0H81_11727 [Grifola frondosa]|uniref:Uncharacterized protein n=1 Tax=Grifola frondosa TaxID=5627 RepID=A0A1C7LUI6_GRIFR|nr:hypothetical protein A0H81_11727 [Grifola frondosa]